MDWFLYDRDLRHEKVIKCRASGLRPVLATLQYFEKWTSGYNEELILLKSYVVLDHDFN